MKIKGGLVALVAVQYEDNIIPKNYEELGRIQSEILSEKNWDEESSKKCLSRLEKCAEVIHLRDVLSDLAFNLDPELAISWEFLAQILSSKGFDRDLIEIVHDFFKLANESYGEIEKLMKDSLIFDSQYNVYVHLAVGACIGDLEVKKYIGRNESWKELALIENEYYASLIAEGCELAIGPNLSDPFNVFKVGVYCANYREMFEAGILNEDNTMHDTLGETKK